MFFEGRKTDGICAAWHCFRPALSCGRFAGHKHQPNDSAKIATGLGQQCTELSLAGTVWQDHLKTDKAVSELRAKHCDVQADLLDTKANAYSNQTNMKMQFAAFSAADTCFSKVSALADFYPGALASLQIDFDICLDKADTSASSETCLKDFGDGASRYLNFGDKLAGCSGAK